ncbi:response regulator [Pseudodesulfovibrio sp. F-1]|uniref:Sensory/regulatory protein RpfC n=1 Tax=Pseudodesulfovibrio alkaliphilus TaxID=2661613 RepID=A0A7K1KRC6_9BACT|nr:response regulator [Pseudodesulfovibrio alkaliphilus]MUM78472.1 response regulator [Pseudodesulfovibrio alkaliphilus]
MIRKLRQRPAPPSLSGLLRQNLTRWVLFPSLCFILLLGGYITLEKTKDFERRNIIIAQSLSKQIVSHVADAENALGSLAQTMARYDDFWFQTMLNNFLQSAHHMERLLYLDADGKILASAPARSELLAIRQFIDRVTSRPSIISPPIASPITHDMVVYLGVRGPDGKVLAGELSMQTFQHHLEDLLPRTEGSVVLCDTFGNLISHPDSNRVATQENIGHLPILRDTLEGHTRTAFYREHGAGYIGTVFKIEPLNWIILISRPVEEVFLPLLGPIIALLSLILLIFALFVTVLKFKLNRTIVTPFAQFTDFIEQATRGHYQTAEKRDQSFAELAIIEEKFSEMIEQIARRENEIRESEARFRQLVETIREVYWISDLADDSVIYVSPTYETVWGRPRQSLIDNPESFFLSIKPAHRLAVVEAFNTLRLEGFEVDEEFQIVLSDGRERWIRARAFPIHDQHGVRVRLAGMAEDITGHKAEQHALLEAKQNAEAASKSKTEFLTNISHELRTPLSGILGMLQLTRESRLTREQAEYIDTAISSSKVLLNVINDILNIAQIEAGKLTLNSQPFPTHEVLNTIYRFFRHNAKSKSIELTIETESEFPPILVGDEVRIRQILFNLVGNSVKFTDQGHIRVWAGTLPKRRDDGTVDVLLIVEDTGIGIPPDKLDYVFESFTQVDGTFTRQYQGTGLGLGIVRSLVGSMHGSITVDSEEGSGTTMYVTLRLGLPAKGSVPQTRRMNEQTMPERSGLSILLVEDDRVNQLAISRMLEKLGHHVTCADNGRMALELLEGSRFDCIFMDIQMPEMDGMEATRRIRTAPELADVSDIPVVAITAHAMPKDRDAFLEAGMTDYLSKPATFHELARLIDRLPL